MVSGNTHYKHQNPYRIVAVVTCIEYLNVAFKDPGYVSNEEGY